MKETNTLDTIRDHLVSFVGEEVHITANHGRRKRSSMNGVLEGTYNSLFTVLVPGPPPSRLSFTYCDVLTHSVVIQPK